MKRLWYLLLLFAATGLRAQTPGKPASRGSIYGGFTLAQPIGAFHRSHPGGQALGLNLGLLYRPPTQHLELGFGLEGAYLQDAVTLTPVTSRTPNYTIKTAHSYLPLHGVLRLLPNRQYRLMPYADGLAGIRVFNSRSKIKQDLFTALGEAEPTVLDKHNWTVFSYGLAGGFRIRPSKNKGWLDLRVVYLEGPLAKYVRRGNVTADRDGYPVYQYTRSETTMLLFQLNLSGNLSSP